MSEEKKYTPEEKKALIEEAIRKAKNGKKRELTLEELEQTAGGRKLTTGEVITEEVIDEYVTIFKGCHLRADDLIIINDELGFFPTEPRILEECMKDYEGAWIDQWATKQKSKVRQENSGDYSIWNQLSTG